MGKGKWDENDNDLSHTSMKLSKNKKREERKLAGLDLECSSKLVKIDLSLETSILGCLHSYY